jgi:hypothetical protein
MLEELQRRSYTENTICRYIHTVEDLSLRFKSPPDLLGAKHIREYQAELFPKRKFTASTVTQYLVALRFFYIKTLKKGWSVAETPYPKSQAGPPGLPLAALWNEVRGSRTPVLRGPTAQPASETVQVEGRQARISTRPSSCNLTQGSL